MYRVWLTSKFIKKEGQKDEDHSSIQVKEERHEKNQKEEQEEQD